MAPLTVYTSPSGVSVSPRPLSVQLTASPPGPVSPASPTSLPGNEEMVLCTLGLNRGSRPHL